MSFPIFNEIPLVCGGLSYTAVGDMSVATTNNVKSIEFRLLRDLTVCPGISYDIAHDSGASPIAVTSLALNRIGPREMQIAISAQTLDLRPARGRHVCSLTLVVGGDGVGGGGPAATFETGSVEMESSVQVVRLGWTPSKVVAYNSLAAVTAVIIPPGRDTEGFQVEFVPRTEVKKGTHSFWMAWR